MLYLTIHKGPSADKSKPIVAISDQRIIEAVLGEIGRLAVGGIPSDPPALLGIPKAGVEQGGEKREAEYAAR